MRVYDSLVLTVITNKELLKKIDETCAEYLNMKGVPMLVIVSSKTAPPPSDNTAYSNAAIMVQNMALEAVDLGVGVRYLWAPVFALNQSPELLAELELPGGFVPCRFLDLGKTDEVYEPQDILNGRVKVVLKQ